jgi:dsDNA-binding SOS-regulon protein
MAVVVQYVVVREGVSEKMVFTSKKEADAYDRLLDIADQMFIFLDAAGVKLGEDEREALSLYLAENREQAVALLRGGKLGAAAGKVEKSKKPARSKKPAASRNRTPILQEVAGGGK